MVFFTTLEDFSRKIDVFLFLFVFAEIFVSIYIYIYIYMSQNLGTVLF